VTDLKIGHYQKSGRTQKAEDHMLKTGDKAPEFTLSADDGKEVSLEDFKGKRLVIFFFPKANTPG
jgi:peroxiredoxin Q/BCP